ncbi:hypothetical protein KL929_000724 [Ogataea haglerorum]|nr:hypothetical protein KL929_000724 [Ogataea haglerorum]KAG7804101.1 hypothetical protein KL944_000970 [Ogataea haglerorum]
MIRSHPSKGHQKTASHSSIDLARQYELDMSKINKYLFRETDQSGRRAEKYLAHVRIIEDSKSQSERPPDNSPAQNKKDRILILSVRSSGRIRLHKARENPDSSVQIGRTWDFEELVKIELDPEVPTGFIFEMGKRYYWETSYPKERRVWLTSVLEHYIRYTGGKKLPQLVNCSVDYFHLEPLLQKFVHKLPSRSATAESSTTMTSETRTGTSATTATANSSPRTRISSPIPVPGTGSPSRAGIYSKSDMRLREVQRTTSALKGLDKERDRKEQERKEQERKEEERKERERKEQERKENERKERERIERERREQEARAQQLREQQRKEQQREMESAEAEKREKERLEQKRQEIEFRERQQQEQRLEMELLEQSRREMEKAQTLTALKNNRGSTSARSVKSIEFIGHRKSHHEIEELTQDDEYETVFDDYADDEPETAPLNLSPNTLPEKPEISTNSLKVPSPVPHNVGKAEKFVPDFDISDEEEENTTMDLLRPHARSRAFSRVDTENPKGGDLSELFDEIGWDPKTDDSKSLQKKLLKELERIQFKRIESLTDVVGSTSAVNQAINMSIKECQSIDPILAFYGIQLASFQDEVDYIEKQGKGLQVETTNKKLLMKELNEILHSVDISDQELTRLLNERIAIGEQNEGIEAALGNLYAALMKIRGNDSDDEEMGQMRALEEKKSKYEKAATRFVIGFKKQFSQLVKASVTSLNSKLQTEKSFDSLNSALERKLAELMTLQGSVAFVKQVSPEDYKQMLDEHKEAYSQFYMNFVSVLVERLVSEKHNDKASSFSFNSEPKDIILGTTKRARSTAESKKLPSNTKILQELGLSTPSPESLSSSQEPMEKHTFATALLDLLRLFFNTVITHQRFVIQFFSLSSSEEYNFVKMVKKPLALRVREFTDSDVSHMEADRDVSDQTFNLMHMIVGESIYKLFKFVSKIVKEDMLEFPVISLFAEKLIAELSSTGQEYVVHSLGRMDSKLVLIWTRHIDKQLHIMEKEPVGFKVYKFSKAFPEFSRRVEEMMALNGATSVSGYAIKQQLDSDYNKLWEGLDSCLHRNAQIMGQHDVLLARTASENIRLELTKTVPSVVETVASHLVLLLNYTWLSEEVKNLDTLPSAIRSKIEELKSSELSDFCDSYAKTTVIGELMSVLDGIEGLIKSHTNPSRTNAYSTANMSKLLKKFESSKLKTYIKQLSTELSSQIMGKMTCGEESEISRKVAQEMEKDLFNNCLNSLCIIYNVSFSKLNQILKDYYESLSNPVDKIFINYNFSKEYL